MAKPTFNFPLLAFSLVVVGISLFGPFLVPGVAAVAPFPIVVIALVVSLWFAAIMRKDWLRFKAMLLGGVSGGLLCMAATWLIALVALQISSRVNTAIDFSKSLDNSRSYIFASSVFFALLGTYVGTIFTWYWSVMPDEPAKAKGR
jgi:hypothetical protein